MSRLYRQLSSRELLNRVGLDQDAAHNLLQDELLNDLLHDLDGDLDTALLARYASLNMTYVFRSGELLCWKPGLRNRRTPAYGTPAVVLEVLDRPHPHRRAGE